LHHKPLILDPSTSLTGEEETFIMMNGAVLCLLLVTVAGVTGDGCNQQIDTSSNKSGIVLVTPKESDEACNIVFDNKDGGQLFWVLSALQLPKEGFLEFNETQPKGRRILKLSESTDEVKVVYTKANNSTVQVNLGKNFQPGDLVLSLDYSVEGCTVPVKSTAGRFSSPVFVLDEDETPVKCEYSLSTQKVDGLVALSFDSFSFSMGAVELWNGATNVTCTGSTDFVAQTVLMYVSMRTNESLDNQTFTASFIAADRRCSQMKQVDINDTFSFTSPNYPESYPEGVICRTIVTAPSDAMLYLQVVDAVFADQFDQLMISDGATKYDRPLLVSSAGNSHTGEFRLSSGPNLWISFVSDYFKADKGFNLTMKPRVFGGSLRDSDSLELKAKENDTRSEPGETDVYYQLFSAPQTQITVTLTNDSVLDPTDSITFYDGLSTGDPMIARFGADDPFYPVFSSGREMLIEASGFLTDGKLTTSYFTGSFFSGEVQPQNQVSVGNEGSYSLRADKFPVEAEWLIQNPAHNTVELVLTSIYLGEANTNVSASVNVYNGLAESSLVLANIYPESLDSNLPKMYMESGVRVNYKSEGTASLSEQLLLQGAYRIIPACGGPIATVSHDNFAVSTPNFPDRYPFNADCKWNYTIRANHSVHVSFVNFDLTQKHFVRVEATVEQLESEVESNVSSVSYGQYGGSVAPDDLIVVGEDMMMEFSSISDGTNDWTVAQGVMANLRLLNCGGNLTSSTGDLTSPAASNTSDLCVWIINVPAVGKENGSVNIIEFDLEITKPDDKSFSLILKDGPSSTSADMPIELKAGKQAKVQSRFNQLYVEYDKPAGQSSSALGFKITYDTYECPAAQQCANGVCMHKNWKCDGVDDCGDFSDEKDCNVVPSNKKSYGPVEMFLMFVVSLAVGIALACLVPPLYRKCRNRYRGEGTGYGNLQEEAVA